LGLSYRFDVGGGAEAGRSGAPPRPATPPPAPAVPAAPAPAPPPAPAASADAAAKDDGGADVGGADERAAASGQLRGQVRSFRGSAVTADVEIEPVASAEASVRRLRAEAGRFQVDVVPGTYEVRIAAPGYVSQRRRVQVEPNGVTLLNVDLKGAR